VPTIPPIVRTSGVITVGRPGAERLTGSTRNSCANPSSRRQNSVTCSTVRSVRWWEVVLDDRDQGARIRSVSGSAVLRLFSCPSVSRPDPTDLCCSCVMPHRPPGEAPRRLYPGHRRPGDVAFSS
jgi:hypothetical protein